MKRDFLNIDYLVKLEDKVGFTRYELLETMRKSGLEVGDAKFKFILQQLLNSGLIVRIGRNMYCVANDGRKSYTHNYSYLACDVAEVIKENHPLLDFRIFEFRQLNEFVNHLLAHNVVFVFVEGALGDFVFHTLKEMYPGKVLLNPTPEIYHRYWCKDMIVIQKLISESPVGKAEKWHTRIEKLLVDLMADNLIKNAISIAEYSNIYEAVYEKYAVDESCLFRYARRRGAEKKIREFIGKNTRIMLRK